MTIAQKANHNFDDGDFELFDENGNNIYWENSEGYWIVQKFDDLNNKLLYKDSDGHYTKFVYDENGNIVYFEDPDFGAKGTYDEKNILISYETIDGIKNF